MFGPFVDSWQWIKSCNPGSPLKKRRLNFITIHCEENTSILEFHALLITLCHHPDLYILGLTVAGSILIFPAGNLNYTDALFFASGCATQSGLNTFVVSAIILSLSSMLTIA